MFYFLAFILGSIWGIFCYVCIYRLPSNESMFKIRSFCPSCKNQINWYDNIPFLSYIILKGKCRNCDYKISFQYFLVELITAISFLIIYFLFQKNMINIQKSFFIKLISIFKLKNEARKGSKIHIFLSPLNVNKTCSKLTPICFICIQIFFEIFTIEAKSNSHFRPIFRYQSHGHEFEQQFDLELNSNKNSSSSYCYC